METAIIQLFSPLFSYSRHYSVILAIIQLFSPLCQLFSPCVFVQCSIILSLCFVQSAVYILSRPSVPGKLNFFNLLEHIIISKANDSVELKPNKKSIGMLAVWLSAPEPEIREV